MRVVHLLRKCNPAEWGGTESAIQRLVDGLSQNGVTSVVYCPRMNGNHTAGPSSEFNCSIKRFRTCLPVVGVSPQRRRQLISVGGNLLSFDLPAALWREPEMSVIHTHALGRLGGIALTVSRWRNTPLVVTIHGGFLDLPASLQAQFRESRKHGWEWGRLFGFLFRSRQVVPQADAILTCNPREAELLRQRFPRKRIVVQPHGVPVGTYRNDCRDAALEAFPWLRDRQMVLSVGRIDPVKNQGWLIDRAPAVFERHRDAIIVLAGACTDEAYGRQLRQRIETAGLNDRIFLVGNFAPADPRLIGLFQSASVVVLPSISETFGLVILEAWAAGAPVIASRTSGASALIEPGVNGWLFDLADPATFHGSLGRVLHEPKTARCQAAEGGRLVATEYDTGVLAGRVRDLYQELKEEKDALRHFAR